VVRVRDARSFLPIRLFHGGRMSLPGVVVSLLLSLMVGHPCAAADVPSVSVPDGRDGDGENQSFDHPAGVY
jgi:hypothetical protein